MGRQEMCDLKETASKCDRSSSCTWMAGDDPALCEHAQTTTIVPGCCYGNPDAAYSKRWMESCVDFDTARDCEMLTNGEGVARCVWEALGEGYDCSQLWPTTTTTTAEPGCCYGDTAASNEMSPLLMTMRISAVRADSASSERRGRRLHFHADHD